MTNGDKPNTAAQFRKRFNDVPNAAGGLENAATPRPTLSSTEITDKADQSKEELYRIIKEYLHDDEDLKKVVDKITRNGKSALKAVADDNSGYLEKYPGMKTYLEVIVRTDGSRPSFMIENDKADYRSSPDPNGVWSGIIESAGECVRHAIRCVGRINDGDNYHIGTGFLIGENIIVTNRHVLQAIATKENDGSWQIAKGTSIDFGHEFKGRASVNPRKLVKVVFCTKGYIDPHDIDHTKLDLVLIQLDPTSSQNNPSKILSFGSHTGWSQEENYIFTIGYPGNPGLEGLLTYSTLLEQLFKSTFGCKRIAPGKIIRSVNSVEQWTVTHDATTLGGNSGSVVVNSMNACAAAGLHYGGTIAAPRENWGHILGHTFDSKNSIQEVTLKECLEANGVIIT